MARANEGGSHADVLAPFSSEHLPADSAPMGSKSDEQFEEGAAPRAKIWRILSLSAFRSGSVDRPRRSSSLTSESRPLASKPLVPKQKQVVAEPSRDIPLSPENATPEESTSQTPKEDEIVCTEPAGSHAPTDAHQKGLVPRMLGLLRNGLAATGDLTKLQVPPQFNLAKSQLQLYGEAIYACDQALLNACTEGATPVERLLAVVRWHLSTVRSPLFGKAPYNPTEGETHHVSAGGLHLLAEQVSHHPPVSAVYASNPSKQTRVLWQHQAAPKFTGSSVDVAIKGRRRLFLDAHGEVYELDSPNLSFRLLPTPAAQWIGHTTVVCTASGLAATVHFKGKSAFGWGKGQGVSGKVVKLGPDGGVKRGEEILSIEGHWDGLVYFSEKRNKKTKTLLYDCAAALGSIQAPQVLRRNEISELESCRIWAPLSKALLASDWDTARIVKKSIENRQRDIRGDREVAGARYAPEYFKEKNGEWIWKGPGLEVPSAPLVCQ